MLSDDLVRLMVTLFGCGLTLGLFFEFGRTRK